MIQDLSLFHVVIADGRYLKNDYGFLRPEVTTREDWEKLFHYNSDAGEAVLAPGAELELAQRCTNFLRRKYEDYQELTVEQSGTITATL